MALGGIMFAAVRSAALELLVQYLITHGRPLFSRAIPYSHLPAPPATLLEARAPLPLVADTSTGAFMLPEDLCARTPTARSAFGPPRSYAPA